MNRDTTKPAGDVADARLFGDWFEARFELEPLAGKAQVHRGAQRNDRLHLAKRLVDRAPGDALARVGHRDLIDHRHRQIAHPNIFALRHHDGVGLSNDAIAKIVYLRHCAVYVCITAPKVTLGA